MEKQFKKVNFTNENGNITNDTRAIYRKQCRNNITNLLKEAVKMPDGRLGVKIGVDLMTGKDVYYLFSDTIGFMPKEPKGKGKTTAKKATKTANLFGDD